MPTPVIMPKFEMTQETGKVLAWLKNEGELVEKGEPLLEVETDKVNQEVESPAAGILAGIIAVCGQVVPIATPIAYILKPGETLPTADKVEAKVFLPDLRPGAPAADKDHTRATPLAWRLAESQGLDLNQISGTGPLGRITKDDVQAAIKQSIAAADAGFVWEGKVRAAPAARRRARELGVDLRNVRGTGPEGRVQPEDVENADRAVAAYSGLAPAQPDETPSDSDFIKAVATPSPAMTAPLVSGSIAIRRITPLTNIRRTIAERMTASVREAPQFTVSLDVDMGRALAVVEDLKAGTASDSRPKVTLTALVVKACAWALRQHPEANASFDQGGIIEWDEVNVGVAIAMEQGLIVPVVRAADRLGLRAIAAQLGDLASRAREGRLKLDDLQGGTFTVSNLGMFGIDRFTAILNPPQAAILAVGRVAKRAEVTADDKIEIRSMCALALTADHRVLDGATAARFLGTIQAVLEHPGLLME